MTESGWICFEDLEVEFKVVVEPKLSFDDAISACERDDRTLACIRSASEFFGVILVGNTLGDLRGQGVFWVGVKTKQDTAPNTPNNYEFIDGFSNSSFFQESQGIFPWREGVPSIIPDHRCVVSRPATELSALALIGWINQDCNEPKGYVCRRYCEAVVVQGDVRTVISLTSPVFGITLAVLLIAIAVAAVALTKTIAISHKLESFKI